MYIKSGKSSHFYSEVVYHPVLFVPTNTICYMSVQEGFLLL